ncbi:uncharacterized protein LOC134727388 [Mytilus trossulus]|uniref:uncharacterized protein LOC134727388 n=1 Tax=Mytilus trossulus TaxID=6551 RepID=UPI003005A4FE
MTEHNIRPRDELENVLKGISDSLHLSDMHLEISSEERMDSLISFLKETFWIDEPLCKSYKLVDTTRRTAYRLKDNLSILMVSNSTGSIIGCLTMCIETIHEADDTAILQIQNENLKKIRTFLAHKLEEKNVFKHFGVEKAVHFLHLSTKKNYQGRGIASKLTKASLTFCKKLGFIPVCIAADCTSNISQKIFEKFEFENLFTVRYDEYKVNDEIVFTNMGDNKVAKFFVKQL